MPRHASWQIKLQIQYLWKTGKNPIEFDEVLRGKAFAYHFWSESSVIHTHTRAW